VRDENLSGLLSLFRTPGKRLLTMELQVGEG